MTRRRKKVSQSRAHDETAARHYKQHLDEQLDEALKETFPASDPIALTPRRRRPPTKGVR